MKKRKSIGLYAILAIPTSIRRDKQLSGLLDSDYIDNYKKKMYISFRNSMYLTSNFSIIRTWKTHKGCQNFLDKVINCSRVGYSTYSIYDEDNKDQFDWYNPIFEIVNIESEWNSYINDKIKEENTRHEVSINNLIKLKI